MSPKTKAPAVGERLPYLLSKLKTPRVLERLEQTAATAREEGWPYEQFLEVLLEAEVFARDASGSRNRHPPRRVPRSQDAGGLRLHRTARRREAADHLVNEIDVGVADDFVEKKLVEREAIEKAAAAGQPLKERYTDPRTGRTHQRRRRPLSNDSINKVLAGVRQVLKEAKRRRLIDHNPLDDRECYLRSAAPTRSFLEVPQIMAVLDAARQLDQQQRPLDWRDVRAIRRSEEPATRLATRYRVSDTLIRRIRRGEIWTEDRPREAGRLPVVATLLRAGPRILELSMLDHRNLDLAAREMRMPRVKTAASERSVPMLPALHEILLTHSADRRSHQGPAFSTRKGTRQHPDNLRARLLAGVLDRANELLADAGEHPIAHMTPHTLRRTFASLLAEIGVSPRRAMYLLGHTDPKFTMRVYQQVLDLGGSGARAARAGARLPGGRSVLAALGPRAPGSWSLRGALRGVPSVIRRRSTNT